MDKVGTEKFCRALSDGLTAYGYLREMQKELSQSGAIIYSGNVQAVAQNVDIALGYLAKSIYRIEDAFGDAAQYGSPDSPDIDTHEMLHLNNSWGDRSHSSSLKEYFISTYFIVNSFLIKLICDCSNIKTAVTTSSINGGDFIYALAASHWARKSLKVMLSLPDLKTKDGIVSFSNVTLGSLLQIESKNDFESDEHFYGTYSDPESMYKTHRKQVEEARKQYRAMEEHMANRSNSSSGCYIATAVYGSYDCPQVWTLRRFRDFWLSRFVLGRAFIELYYRISPKLVEKFGSKEWFKKPWKRFLDKFVMQLKKRGYSDTRYLD